MLNLKLNYHYIKSRLENKDYLDYVYDHNLNHPDYELWAYLMHEKFMLALSSKEISKMSNVPLRIVKKSFEDFKMIGKSNLETIFKALEKYKLSYNVDENIIKGLEEHRIENEFNIQ